MGPAEKDWKTRVKAFVDRHGNVQRAADTAHVSYPTIVRWMSYEKRPNYPAAIDFERDVLVPFEHGLGGIVRSTSDIIAPTGGTDFFARIVALAKHRREAIEETAFALGVSSSSIRAYKRLSGRAPRPKLIRRLEELEELARRNQSERPRNVESFKVRSDAEAYTARRLEQFEIGGPSPMQRIVLIQNLAEMNRAELLAIKEEMKEISATLREIAEQNIKEKKRGT